MSDVDTSAEAVERLAAHAEYAQYRTTAATIRALLAERDRLSADGACAAYASNRANDKATALQMHVYRLEAEWDVALLDALRFQRERDQAEAERDRLREALRIIAGYQQCIDNLMSNVDVARAALGEDRA